MKIKTVRASYDQVVGLPKPLHKKPKRPNLFFRTLIRILATKDLIPAHFTLRKEDLQGADREPCLILMNHSCFLDLEIASRIFYPKPYGIVTTSDGFVGKNWLMRQIGCIPTQKFVSDLGLIRDMEYMLKKKRTSVLMYPEASYSFDGCATPLPRKMGGLLKLLKVPVLHVHTDGAFLRTPLYNGLRKRKIRVSATLRCLLTPEQIREKSVEELDRILDEAFGFDHFKWQLENKIPITEPDRAAGLERVLYKCPHCLAEGRTEGVGAELICHACGKRYRLGELGQMEATDGTVEIAHIPDWFRWERECVKQELIDGRYLLDTDVEIGMMVDRKAIYMVGSGHLTHDSNGFLLTGCDGKLNYAQKPLASYSLYSDYFWYEIGDMICIGNQDCLYYCFPKQRGVVAKTRLAAEELFKLSMASVRGKSTV
ncbi:MAG: 1-acyl-sn-glycerol-3-phosphate acyltransferase [Clostridia bacterium]|nr:1-acyl-sn-glycerol-3-phosphate acyltransferase [Clostridia bacterium]